MPVRPFFLSTGTALVQGPRLGVAAVPIAARAGQSGRTANGRN